jgi:uncharacterized protein YaiL (DUF2058 family)
MPKVRKAAAAARYENARCTLIFPQRRTEEDLADARAVFEEQKAKHLKRLKRMSREQLHHTMVWHTPLHTQWCTPLPWRHTEEDLAVARAVFDKQKAKHLKHLKGLSKEQKEQLCHTIVDEHYLAIMQALAAPIPQGDARPA